MEKYIHGVREVKPNWGTVEANNSNSGSINLELQHIATRMGRFETRYWKHLTWNKTHRQSRDEE